MNLGMKIGVVCGLLTILATVVLADASRDAQAGIAIFLSPCYGTWVGVSVALGIGSYLNLVSPKADLKASRLVNISGVVVGIIGVLVFISFVVGELIQFGVFGK